MSDSQIITCPNCGAKNRLSPTQSSTPLCGRCKTPLPTSTAAPPTVLELTDATFPQLAEQSPLPILVDFWAPWCGPCRMIAPIIESLATEFVGKIRFAKLNVDQNQSTAAKFNANSIPLLVILKNGKEVDRLVGAYPAPEIRRHLQNLIN